MTAPAFGFAAQALTRLNAFATSMTAAAVSLTGQDVDLVEGAPEEGEPGYGAWLAHRAYFFLRRR